MKWLILISILFICGCCSTQECRDKRAYMGMVMMQSSQQFSSEVNALARQQQQQIQWNNNQIKNYNFYDGQHTTGYSCSGSNCYKTYEY